MTIATSAKRPGAKAPADTGAGPVLAVSGLTVSIQDEDGERPVVSELSFTLCAG